MNELDMSRPGSELFPEAQVAQPYNSYLDVNAGQVVENPGVKEVATPVSDKEFNFRALRDEAAKLKEEREYWKGQAEAYAKQPIQQQEPERKDVLDTLDWDDTRDVRKAFDYVRQENNKLREEIRDSMASMQAKAQHQNWSDMVTQHVPELTGKNPIFAEMIRNVSNPYEAAYLLAELNARSKSETPAPSRDAQRVIANSQKPQTIASVGGHGTLNQADYYASMSDEDFMKIAAKNLANI